MIGLEKDVKILAWTHSPKGGLLSIHHGDDADDVGRVGGETGVTLAALPPPICGGFVFVL
jgi:hypothetical protein